MYTPYMMIKYGKSTLIYVCKKSIAGQAEAICPWQERPGNKFTYYFYDNISNL